MLLTRHELNGHAEFCDDSSFRLKSSPFAGDIPPGLYELPRRSGEAHLYRLNHPLAEAVLAQARSRELPAAEVQFDYGGYDGKITVLESLIGKSGWLALSVLTVESFDQAEDHLIFAAVTDSGQPVDQETAARLLTLPGRVKNSPLPTGEGRTYSPLPPGDGSGVRDNVLEQITQERRAAIQQEISERNAKFFEAEAEKFDGWADDLKLVLEREIKEIDRQIKEARRADSTALTLEEKLAAQKHVKALEAQRNQKRRSLFEAQDQVDKQRDTLIAQIEGKLRQRLSQTMLFSIRWRLQ